MCTGGPSAPPPAPKAPEAARAPEAATSTRDSATRTDAQRRRKAAGGGGGTILTSARGVQDGAATAQKTLLGQ